MTTYGETKTETETTQEDKEASLKNIWKTKKIDKKTRKRNESAMAVVHHKSGRVQQLENDGGTTERDVDGGFRMELGAISQR